MAPVLRSNRVAMVQGEAFQVGISLACEAPRSPQRDARFLAECSLLWLHLTVCSPSLPPSANDAITSIGFLDVFRVFIQSFIDTIKQQCMGSKGGGAWALGGGSFTQAMELYPRTAPLELYSNALYHREQALHLFLYACRTSIGIVFICLATYKESIATALGTSPCVVRIVWQKQR